LLADAATVAVAGIGPIVTADAADPDAATLADSVATFVMVVALIGEGAAVHDVAGAPATTSPAKSVDEWAEQKARRVSRSSSASVLAPNRDE